MVDHFGWASPEAVGRLTPRQVQDYLFHAREKDSGAIKRPVPQAPGPATEEEYVARFASQARALGMPEARIAQGVAQIREHYQKRKGESGGDRPAGGG